MTKKAKTVKLPPKYVFLWWHLNNYFDVIYQFNYVSRMFGLATLDVYPGDGNRCGRFISRYFGFLIWFTYFIVFFRGNFIENYFQSLSPNEIANNVRRILLIFGIWMNLICIAATYFTTTRCVVLVKRLIKFDEEINCLGTEVNLRRESITITTYIVFNMAMSIGTVIFSAVHLDKYDSLQPFVFRNVPYYIFNLVFVIFVSRFAVFSYSVIYRYKILNKSFWRHLMIRQGKYFEQLKERFNKRAGYGSVLDYARLHGLLTDSVGDINRCYAVQLMVIIGGIFVYLITTVFTIYRTFVLKDDSLYEVTLWFMTWCIFYIVPIFVVIIIGSSVQKNGKRTSILIHRAINECQDEKLCSELKSFSQQLLHHHPIVSCGLFTYDWTFMYSIISAITTYLMILIQFDSTIPEVSTIMTPLNSSSDDYIQ